MNVAVEKLRCSINPEDFNIPGRKWIWLKNSALAIKLLRDLMPHDFQPPIVHFDLFRILNNRAAAVVVYHAFTPSDCTMSCASLSPRWLTHDFLREVFSAPFFVWQKLNVKLGVQRDNLRSLKMVRGLGFTQMHETERSYSFAMNRNECEWIK